MMMMVKRWKLFAFPVFLLGCDLTQFNPQPHRDRYEKERIVTDQKRPQLTDDGHLPKLETPKPTENAASTPAPAPTAATTTTQNAQAEPAAAAGPSEADIKSADQKFATLCSTCHGLTGKGDTDMAKALKPSPRDFSNLAWQKSVSDEHIAKVIKEGGAANGLSPSMAPWGAIVSDGEIKALVAKIRKFGGKH